LTRQRRAAPECRTAIGSYEQVGEKFLQLFEVGLDGMASILVNYVREIPVLRDEVLPRLERLKIRHGRD